MRKMILMAIATYVWKRFVGRGKRPSRRTASGVTASQR
jgi:hypothetical protein